MKPILTRFRRHDGGTTAIEFALVAMPFLLFIFGILEIALVAWFGSLMNDGAHEAASYLRSETMKCTRRGTATNNCTAATIAGMRAAACQAISPGGMSCDAAKLKLAVYVVDDPIAIPIPTTNMIDEKAVDLKTGRAYIIALGYEWPFSLPTTKMLMVSDADRSQIQARIYYTTAERALR